MATSSAKEVEVALLGGRYTRVPDTLAVGVGPRGSVAIKSVCLRLLSGEYQVEQVQCLCGETEERCIATIDRYGIPHRTVMCARCALIRTNPRMTRESYEHFYAHYYRAIYERAAHDPERYFATQLQTASQRARHTLRRVNSCSRASVAEIGCGAGWNLLPYQERSWRAVGWDVDDTYLALGRRHGLDLRHGFMLDACASGEKFDLVILSHVLEHLTDPINELIALRSILKPRGLLSIEVPSAFAVSDLCRYFQNAHTFSFVPQTLLAVMEHAGYKRFELNSRIESLWFPTGARSPIPSDPKLVNATISALLARVDGTRLLQHSLGIQQRAERARETFMRWPRWSLGDV